MPLPAAKPNAVRYDLVQFDPEYELVRTEDHPSLPGRCNCLFNIFHQQYRYHLIEILKMKDGSRSRYIHTHFYCCSDECAEREAAGWSEWKSNPPPLRNSRLGDICQDCRSCGIHHK